MLINGISNRKESLMKNYAQCVRKFDTVHKTQLLSDLKNTRDCSVSDAVLG